MTIQSRRGTIKTPDLSPKSIELDADYCNRTIGLQLNPSQVCMLLRKARFDAKHEGNKITASYLPYRQDIMDSRDVIEDIAIAYGYDKLQPEEARIATTGKCGEMISLKERLTEMLLGLNMQEIATFTLTNKETLFSNMNLEEEGVTEVSNSISENYTYLRNYLMPCVLEFLSQNTKKEFPQKVFEIGECFDIKEEKTNTNLVVAITHSKTNFTEIKQVLDYIMKNLNIPYSIKEAQHPSFIEGRIGNIIINNKKTGIIGEINPKVLASWNLEMPVAIMEINCDAVDQPK